MKQIDMLYTIKIEGMEFRAAHGCFEVEQQVGGNYVVDIELSVDDGGDTAGHGGAAEADDVTRTVNYVDVYNTVREQMAIPSRIIENVTLRVVEAVKQRFPQVKHVSVMIAKLAPPLGGKASRVSATILK